MNFCLIGVFKKNAVVECGSSVGANPQIPSLIEDVSGLSVWVMEEEYFGVERH